MARWDEQGNRIPPPLCEFEGCDRPRRNRGLCNAHAQQRRRGVELFPLGPRGWKSKGRQTCTFEGCDKMNHSHGLCNTHFRQKQRGVELRPIHAPRPTAADGFRWCSRCSQFRDEEEFGWDTKRDQPKRTCRPCCNEQQSEYVAKNRARVNLNQRITKRGITVERYHELLAQQQGRCAICRRERPLDIDHCHKRGHVRELLCGPCNRALGFLDDDPAIAEAAAAYLRKHRGVSTAAD